MTTKVPFRQFYRGGSGPTPFQQLSVTEADYQRIGEHLQLDELSAYDLIVLNTAKQPISFWDNFDGEQGEVQNGVQAGDRYTIQNNNASGRAVFTRDTTTGHMRFQTQSSTTAGDFSALLLIGHAGQTTNSARTRMRAAENWRFKCLIQQDTAPVGGTQDYIAGFRDNGAAGLASGASDGIYFRSINAANWFLVCRNGGSETTLNMGVAPTATLILLEFKITNDGGAVEGYYNGRLVGKVRSNIPTALNVPVILHDNRAATVTTAGQISCYGWGWKGDLVA